MNFCLGHILLLASSNRSLLEEMFARCDLRPVPDQEATVHGWAVRAAKRLPA